MCTCGIAPWIIKRDTYFKQVLGFMFWNDYFEFTPQSILRSFGSFGPRVWKWVGEKSRYRELDEDSWEYLYYNQVKEKSGDLAFIQLLTQDGWGLPLFEKLDKLKTPLRLIYGENDYVRPEFGQQIISQTKVFVDMVVIKDVGHHLYFKQFKEFNDNIIEFINKKDSNL